MHMPLLLTSLEEIEHFCTHEKAKLEPLDKASYKGKKGKTHPGTKSTARVSKKVCFKKHYSLCKRHGGACTMHNTRDCHRFEKDRKEKSNFCTTKKGGKKVNPVNQNFAQLTKNIEKLKKALKKSGKEAKKRQYKDSNSNSKWGVGLGTSTRKLVKLEITVEKSKFTHPSPIKSTPTTITRDCNDLSTTSVSNAGDVMMISPSQKEKLLNTNSIQPYKDPSKGKITAIIAVMRVKPKHGHHCHHSNKHYRQKLVWVLLDSGSDRNLIFNNKDKPMLLPFLKRLVSPLWNTSNGMFQTKYNIKLS